jgi:predicted CoA-substrate-specific enzyme activase
MGYYIGIDCGSVSMKAVVIDVDKEIVDSAYIKNHGLIDTVKLLMKEIDTDVEILGVGITGSGREFISTVIGGDTIESEVLCHYVATTTLHQDVGTIFDIGGEDCKMMSIDDKGRLIDFQMNRDCGGGTGAMIESIANRMGVELEQVGELALQSRTNVVIPSKCGIFAQSAVVSKLNKGVPKEDILMGVCRGLIGNYFTMLCKGKKLRPSYVFQGATAKNKALVKCFSDELGVPVIVPEQPELMGAYGAALHAMENVVEKSNFTGFSNMTGDYKTATQYMHGCTNNCEVTVITRDGERVGVIGKRCDKCQVK